MDIVNEVYMNIFVRYEQLLNKFKLTSTLTSDYISDKPMIGIVIINKEMWNLYYRYFAICEFENFYFLMVFVLALGGCIGSILFGILIGVVMVDDMVEFMLKSEIKVL